MSVTYISELLTREEFYDRAFQRGKSKACERLTRTAISNLDAFCLDKYGFETDKIVTTKRRTKTNSWEHHKTHFAEIMT